MKKLGFIILIITLTGCKSSSHKCDAYGFQDDDISKENLTSHKKYVGFEVIK